MCWPSITVLVTNTYAWLIQLEKNAFDCQFGFRVDIDTIKGFIHGVPRLLAVFNNVGIKATFALTTGPDRSLFNIVNLFPPLAKYFGINRKISGKDNWKKHFPGIINRINSSQIHRGPFFTNPFDRELFIKADKEHMIVKNIQRQGHEVILHGYDHFLWANCLENLTQAEQETLLIRGIKEFRKITRKKPKGFAAPAFNITPSLLPLLKEKGFKYCSNYSLENLTRVTTPSVNGKDCCIEIPVLNQPLYAIYKEFIAKGNIDFTIEKINNMNVKVLFFYLHAGIEGFLESSNLVGVLNELKTAFSSPPIKIIDYVRFLGTNKT